MSLPTRTSPISVPEPGRRRTTPLPHPSPDPPEYTLYRGLDTSPPTPILKRTLRVKEEGDLGCSLLGVAEGKFPSEEGGGTVKCESLTPETSGTKIYRPLPPKETRLEGGGRTGVQNREQETNVPVILSPNSCGLYSFRGLLVSSGSSTTTRFRDDGMGVVR